MDEIIVELEENDAMQGHVKNIEKLMVEAMEVATPNVKIKVESALMKRWYKEAETIYNENGDLQIWNPDLMEAPDE